MDVQITTGKRNRTGERRGTTFQVRGLFLPDLESDAHHYVEDTAYTSPQLCVSEQVPERACPFRKPGEPHAPVPVSQGVCSPPPCFRVPGVVVCV